jgi:hypothetical protein
MIVNNLQILIAITYGLILVLVNISAGVASKIRLFILSVACPDDGSAEDMKKVLN